MKIYNQALIFFLSPYFFIPSILTSIEHDFVIISIFLIVGRATRICAISIILVTSIDFSHIYSTPLPFCCHLVSLLLFHLSSVLHPITRFLMT